MANAIRLESPYKYDSWRKYANKQQLFIDKVMIPIMETKDWDLINDMPILLDDNGRVLISFSDDEWNFSNALYASGIDDAVNINFASYLEDSHGKLLHLPLPRQIINELKCYALESIYLARKKAAKLSSVRMTISNLKFLAINANLYGMNTFSSLSVKLLREMIDLGYVELKTKTINTINQMAKLHYIPIEMQDYGKYTTKSFPEIKALRDGEQYCVIPISIYKVLFEKTESLVNEFYAKRQELASKIRDIQRLQIKLREKTINKIRLGEVSMSAYFNKVVGNKIEALFSSKKIKIHDNYREGKKWRELWDEIDPSFKGLNIKAHNTPRMINEALELEITNKYWKGLADFKETLQEVDAACRFLIHALTGMRVDELFRMHPDYGLQKTIIKGQEIHLITTRQSKITRGSNSIDDVYVTTRMGARAYQLLNAIHAPLREQFTKDKNKFFGGFRGLLKREPQEKNSDGITGWVKHWLKNYTLTQDDIKSLDMSDPERTINMNVGDTYSFSVHQTRRSLAYYVVGFELLYFPQLKQQFSHYSLAMTRWYANHANSFKKMHQEIAQERVSQKSEIMARVYAKIANKERVGGGKARNIMKNLAKTGKNYFEGEDGNRLLSPIYWKRAIETKEHHVHAIAPNMYCTNSRCSMRATIDLSDCIDCDYDFFEMSNYAEGIRINAMRDLLVADELNELSPSFATKMLVQIKSAERIMTELGTPFEAFIAPSEIEQMIIPIQQV